MGTRRLAALVFFLAAGGVHPVARGDSIEVGSKRFTESYILAEIVAQTAKGRLKPGLGNTGIVFAALKAGSIDVYPEYTGTIAKEILKLDGNPNLDQINRALAPQGLRAPGAARLSHTHPPPPPPAPAPAPPPPPPPPP